MGYIDTHCHLNETLYASDLKEILVKCDEEEIDMMIIIGFDMASSIRAVEIAHMSDKLYAVIGFHPSEADHYDETMEAKLADLSKDPKVIGIGEIGLEYHWEDVPSHEVQKAVFRKQVMLANKLDLPIIIHNRDAMEDTFKLLEEFKLIRGIMHCYSGSLEMAERFMKQGLYLSFAGPVTFKNALEPKRVASSIPMDRLLVETDCPYLTPHPFRGETNYPYYVKLVSQEIARMRGINIEDFQKMVKDNVFKLFFNWKK